MEREKAIVEMHGVTKRFGSTKAMDDVNFTIYPGTIVGLLGANGAGKSTLLRHIIGLYLPDAGAVETFGCNAAKLSPKELSHIGYVHQEGRLVDFMTVGQLIDYVRCFYETWDNDLEQKYIEDFEIDRSELVKYLSPGQRQRLSILLAICYRPQLLLLDEPVSALDPVGRSKFLDLLLEIIQSENRAVVISSHILSDVEKVIDHVVIMEKGKIIRDCAYDELLERYAKIHLSSIEGELPANLPFANIVDCKRNNGQAVVTVEGYVSEDIERQAEKINCEIEVQRLTLEEIYKIIVC